MKEKRVKKILQTSYLNQAEASKKLSKHGYTYDPELSTNESKVFVDKKGNQNIAFRGTRPWIAKDWGSDFGVGLGLHKYDTRFKEAKHLTKLVEDKYGRPANVFGHSLGGKLAEESGARGHIYTDNKATGLGDIGKVIPKQQTDYRNRNDAFSLLSVTQKHDGNLKTKVLDNHPLDIFGNHKISI